MCVAFDDKYIDTMENNMKTYIHVNQHKIRGNLKHGTNDPVITVKEGKSNTYCHEVKIDGPSVVRYGENGEKILACGARVVIETESKVEIIK
jgi:hypothetical protein